MIKSNLLILISPIILNLMIMIIMMTPSKINKSHPLSLMITLISLTSMICLKMNLTYKTWIPFITFLVMIGGLMVIFMYITSLINNELFNFNYKLMWTNLIKILPIMMISLMIMMNFNYLMFNINKLESYNFENYLNTKISMNILYKELNNKSSYFLMMYLLYSMICIMSICYKLKSPLRQILF